MFSDEYILQVWNLTRPNDKDFAADYLEKLKIVLSQSVKKRYENPFKVAKKSGGFRIIVPAKPDLVMIQYILASWIKQNYPKSSDYCYTGKGVLAAVNIHMGSKCAVVVDLKSAFDQITWRKLRSQLMLYGPDIPERVLDVICELLTYPFPDGRYTPQGCVSTPYTYNLVARLIDKELNKLKKSFKGLIISRYSDNICLSSPFNLDMESLLAQVVYIMEKVGFELSWTKVFTKPPFEYLGTLIFEDHLGLDTEKYDEYLQIINEAINNPTPAIYRHQVRGIFNWAKRVCGPDQLPDDLLNLVSRYFEISGRPHKDIVDLLAKKLNYRLF